MPVDPNLLSASSVTLGVMTALYAHWSVEVTSALALEKAYHREDRNPAISELKRVGRYRALPIAVVSTVFVLLLIPPVLDIVLDAGAAIIEDPRNAAANYDPVAAMFAMVWLLITLLVGHSWGTWCRVRRTVEEFRNEP